MSAKKLAGFWKSRRIALAVCAVCLCATIAAGDEPSRLSRFFRLGPGSSKPANPLRAAKPVADPDSPTNPSQVVGQPVEPSEIDVQPGNSSTADSPKILPQSRVSRAITNADPLVTRIALGRSTDGRQFGMFLQVFEDGTVVDSEGVHALGAEAVRPIAESLARGEIFRVKGHCGSPSTDFIEHVQMVVYDRRLGTLRANSLSFAGNGQGCDHAVKHLQTLLDALQTKLTQPKSVPTEGNIASPVGSSIPLSNRPEINLSPIPQ